MIHKQPLFEARTGGYHIYRIPGLVVTSGGAVLATTEARRGAGGDWDCNDVVMRRSLDGGRSWNEPRVLVHNDRYGEGPVSNFVMIADPEPGFVHALYCWNYARAFYMVSADDGESFSKPVEITGSLEGFHDRYPWRVIAFGPGHGTKLRSGRMIVPVWMSHGTGTEFGSGKLGHRPSCVSLVYSDDHGSTWHCGEIVVAQDEVRNPSETLCVELSDGSVYFNIRNESEEHRRMFAISPDGVRDWSDPMFDEQLLEPVCMASLIRYSWPRGDEPGRVLFANPDNLEGEFPTWEPARDRKRLTVKMSEDDCRTWTFSRILEEGASGYSDLAVPADGTILCLYECGQVDHMYDSRSVTLARFDLEWVRRG